MKKSRTVIATPPGATIKEQLKNRNMSQKEFALRMDMSEKHISKLINGEVQLTGDVALRLELVLGIPAHVWNKLEAIYRDKLMRAEAENDMEQDIEESKNYPYNEMAKNGWVEKTNKPNEKVINLRKFFEVVKLDLIKMTMLNKIACRRLGDGDRADYALVAWAQKARLEARDISVKSVNTTRLERNLKKLRYMTNMDPVCFCPQMKALLADCGIALVFLPHIGGSFLHGATFYDGKKIVMGLTVRGRDADRFWFSLFHEIGHVLCNHINHMGSTTVDDEMEADDFARDLLIPNEPYRQFIGNEDFSVTAITFFAQTIDIAPGIVIGRLQKDGYIGYNQGNRLKIRYALAV
jgi:HTH-type transcriptional regulator/antitoxin HigA